MDDLNGMKKIKEVNKFKVLFVCMGNTCRSPMAEVILKSHIPNSLKKYIDISSAGLQTFSDLAPTVESELVARLQGFSLTLHRSRQVSESMLEQSDLIVCMEPTHAQLLKDRYPPLSQKIHNLRSMGGGEDKPIPDPFGEDIEFYKTTIELISREIGRIKSIIWRKAREKLALIE